MKDKSQNLLAVEVPRAARTNSDHNQHFSKATESVLPAPTFGPLVATCKRYGINRGMAFRLARERAVATFLVGRKRFVDIASLESLPERLRKSQGGVA